MAGWGSPHPAYNTVKRRPGKHNAAGQKE